MTAFLTGLVVAGAFVYAVHTLAALAGRALAVIEARDARAAQTPEKVRVPADLMALADGESEPWAKEQLRTSLREAYEELGNWNDVRARMT
jgi:hypothetical protein